MITDDSFFGLSRAGVLEEVFRYPGILKSNSREHISLEGNIFMVHGQQALPVPHQEPAESRIEQPVPVWVSEDIVVIPGGAELIQRPKKLVEKLHKVRSEMGFSKLIYLQGVADPYILPVLVYAGVSLFDDSTIRIESQKGLKYTMFGRELSESNPYESNLLFVQEMLETIRASIASGTLREIIEKYQISSKALEIMRLLDNDSYGEFEIAFPRRTRYIKANSLESLRRPDLRRYRQYISGTYARPEGKSVAVLLPCSARKPYSTSKSHRQIIDALAGLRNSVHEIIVTSPVGVVPRDLEATYPASAYDIPVIGEWYEDEKVMINGLLRDYFSRNTYEHVIAFVTDDLEFIMDAIPEGSKLIPWKKDSNSLQLLREAVKELVSQIERPAKKINQKLETFTKVAEYQFGSWIRDYLAGCKIVRNYNTEMLVKDGKPVLVFNDRLGKFTINKASGPWFLENSKFLVEIDDFKPTANIYAVGVLGTTGDVRQEDEVVLHHKGNLKGVGIAKMPAKAMVDLKKGVAVKVRN